MTLYPSFGPAFGSTAAEHRQVMQPTENKITKSPNAV
jgi:hypothetical protein